MSKKTKISEKFTKVLNTNLSFAGCGFLGIYHVGVGVCFKRFAPHFLLQKIAGASAGALVACCLLLDTPLDSMAQEFFEIVSNAREQRLGPFSPTFNIQKILMEKVAKYLPPDAHLKVNGRLHLSLTRIYDGKNIVVSQFNSREDLLDALSCAFFIPGFSGLIPPKFHHVRYMDGAFSDNLVAINENTITVSPFSGESDICPKNERNIFINLSNTSMELSAHNAGRLIRALIPPPPTTLSELCNQGYNDALEFLCKNDLISCGECVEIHRGFLTTRELPREVDFEAECDECLVSRVRSRMESMPDYIVNVLSGNLQGPNSVLSKCYKVLTLPLAIPYEFTVYAFSSLPATAISIFENRLRDAIDQLKSSWLDDSIDEDEERSDSDSSSLSDDSDRKSQRRGGQCR